jgi:type IV secretory pathway VirB2 component (pilin)
MSDQRPVRRTSLRSSILSPNTTVVVVIIIIVRGSSSSSVCVRNMRTDLEEEIVNGLVAVDIIIFFVVFIMANKSQGKEDWEWGCSATMR